MALSDSKWQFFTLSTFEAILALIGLWGAHLAGHGAPPTLLCRACGAFSFSSRKISFQFLEGIFVAQLVDAKKNMKQESLFQECSPEAVRKAADAGHLTKFKSFQSVCW